MPTSAPVPTEASGWALGEDLGVGTDADLEILRPDPLRDEHVLEARRVRRTGTDVVQAVADHRRGSTAADPSALAASPRACSSMTRSSRLATNVTPLALTAWRSQGASSHGARSIAAVVSRVRQQVGHAADSRQIACPDGGQRVVEREQPAAGRGDARQVVDGVAADDDRRRARRRRAARHGR